MPPLELDPFRRLDKERVVGALAALRSLDPDVLHAHKTAWIARAGAARKAGRRLMIAGGLVSLTLVGLPVGALLLGAGAWLRRRGRLNRDAVEDGYAEFVGAPRA